MQLTVREIAFVAGGGKYGTFALQHLAKTGIRTLICDKDRHCQATKYVKNEIGLEDLQKLAQRSEPALLIGDATEALTRLLLDGIVPSLIVPCVPFHFAAKVLTSYFGNNGLEVRPDFEPLKLAFEKSKPEDIEYRLYRDNALAVASKMPFDLQCKSGCNQPRTCPVTGRRLLKPMYKLIEEILDSSEADFVKVLRSRLIAPNVGGFRGEELMHVADLCTEKEPCTLAIATSCSCHAIANRLRLYH
jgi:hypothetical protein